MLTELKMPHGGSGRVAALLFVSWEPDIQQV